MKQKLCVMRLDGQRFDVFWDRGWDHWARFEIKDHQQLRHIGGSGMPSAEFYALKAYLFNSNKHRKQEQK